MIPVELRITNFRSFRGTQSFSFPRAPGLYFMQGVNLVEPRLEGNAAGKTTVWDALTWCFFEKTARGLKAGNVCNWDAGKGARVEFDFLLREDDPRIWTMARNWSPNTWTLAHTAEYITDEEVVDLVREEDNPVLRWLALGFEPFLNCVLTAQGQPMFLDMKREPQAALFSEVMALDAWLDYSARASKEAADADRRIRAMEADLARMDGEMASCTTMTYTRASEDWAAERKKRLGGLEDEHASLVAARKGLRGALDEATARCEAARKGVAAAQPEYGLYDDLRKTEGDVIEVKSLLRSEEARNAVLYERAADLEKNAACPECGQVLTPAHRDAEVRRITRERDASDTSVAGLAASLRKAEASLEKFREESKGEADRLSKAKDALDDAQRAESGARRALDLNDRDLDRVEEEAARLAEERDPYADMEARARDIARRLREDAADLRDRIAREESGHYLLQYWTRGFKEVRLSLISEALTELEIEVNSCCDALGLLGWELGFSVDRETKGGGISRGFDCSVRSPHNDRAVPWEVWSGGEGQRLRIAGTMGLADLIRSRTGASIPLEVWDEPTNGLSPQGIRDLLECLSERARKEGRQIWLVDHKAHDFGGFAGGAVVTKTAAGSEVEQW